MAVLLVHIRPTYINMQEENLIYTWWWNRHLVSLMRGGPGPRAFPITYYWERKVKWGEDFHFPVSDLLPGRLLFIPKGGIWYTNDHRIKYHRTSQAQNTLILRAEIKQHDSFSTIIFTTGPRAFLLFFVEWEPLTQSYLHKISLEVWLPFHASLAKVFG